MHMYIREKNLYIIEYKYIYIYIYIIIYKIYPYTLSFFCVISVYILFQIWKPFISDYIHIEIGKRWRDDKGRQRMNDEMRKSEDEEWRYNKNCKQ